MDPRHGPSTDIEDQRILQSDWTRGTPGNTRPKVLALGDRQLGS